MRTALARVTLGAGALLVLAVSYRAYTNREQPNNPDWLLRQADDDAWRNEWIAATPIYRKAELLYEQRHEPQKALYARASQVIATSELASFSSQIANLTEELRLPAAQDAETRIRILTIRGMLETNYDAGLAKQTWTEVGELARNQNHYMLAARAMGEVGIADFLLGDISMAQKKVFGAYEIAKYLGDPGARVRYASVYGAGLVELKKYQQALKPLDEAIRVTETTKGLAYPSIATASKIQALGGLGRYTEAFNLANDALARVTARHLPMHIVDLLHIRAGVYESSGRTQNAIADYQAALQEAGQVFYWRGLTETGGLLAALYERQGDYENALRTIEQAIDANRQIPDELYFMPRNLAIKARILAHMGRTAESNNLYQKSADLIDSLLANVPTPDVERQLIAALGQVYSGYFDSLCAQGDYGSAFRIIEKARGRLEVQSLEHVQASDPHPAGPEEKELIRLNLELLADDDPGQRARLLDKIGDAEERLPPDLLAGRTAVTPVPLRELQADLRDPQLFVEYVMDETQSYVLAITGKSVHRYLLPPRRVLEHEASEYRSSIIQQKTNTVMGRTLFQQIFGCIAEYQNKSAVIIVPDGQLHLLPFEALIDGNQYVIESHTIAVSPSGTVFHILKDREREVSGSTHPYVGVAAWTRVSQWPLQRVFRVAGGLEESQFVSLPESKREVETIGADLPRPSTILLGTDASETRFKQLPLDHYNVLHLALHGYADLAYPDRSALVFAPEKDRVNDGLLQVREIRQLHLQASLVTLSACNTGIGPVGEAGVNNIVTAFIDAGARSVVSTLWDLEDHVTTRLMTDFYANLKDDTKAEALRKAQVALLRNGFGPFYWASFEIVGDPDSRLFPQTPFPPAAQALHGQAGFRGKGQRPL
jgi:CHAT domain-containing protein/tetratricopeptide (TPR) repeat protein